VHRVRGPLEKTEVSDLKRISLVLVLALALSLVFVGSAYANFGPHGGYIDDTDACAGCHRAHTSFSTLTFRPREVPVGWDDADNPSALLVGNAATMEDFCNACHGDAAPGASTNVVSGIFDSGPSAHSGIATPTAYPDGTVTEFQTASTFNAPLNGGGFVQSASLVDWEADATTAFKAVTSTHSMEQVGVLWGAGNAVAGQTMDLTCTNCHDPHGSSNYRLLKDSVNGNAVGGYTDAGDPTGMVFSTEIGYDDVYADNGWLKHEAGQAQVANYRPNYTSGSSQIRSGVAGASLSAWCSGCHEEYDEQSSDYDYSPYESNFAGGAAVGNETRHRHPVDITLQQGDTILQVKAQATATTPGTEDRKIPLEVNPGTGNVRQYQVGCLTCHFAHGSGAAMSGWAAAHLESSTADPSILIPVRDAVAGVDPDKDDVVGGAVTGSSALLRTDNRGVCERCHDK